MAGGADAWKYVILNPPRRIEVTTSQNGLSREKQLETDVVCEECTLRVQEIFRTFYYSLRLWRGCYCNSGISLFSTI